jgi:hypothetical protein
MDQDEARAEEALSDHCPTLGSVLPHKAKERALILVRGRILDRHSSFSRKSSSLLSTGSRGRFYSRRSDGA